ncbi:MAG TPA: hypothetical protein G4O14_06420 [Anaerolineae bacterium]|nr:hypothetical protein [Anaerolineae bacterium]
MGFTDMVRKVSFLHEEETQDTRDDLPLAPLVIKVRHLEEECYVTIKPGGMVDVAVRELGAKIVKVEVIEPEEVSEE